MQEMNIIYEKIDCDGRVSERQNFRRLYSTVGGSVISSGGSDKHWFATLQGLQVVFTD